MTKIQIKGMTCNHCKMRVEKALKQAGCGKVKVELETGTATADTRGLSAEQIRETIESLGFQCGDVSICNFTVKNAIDIRIVCFLIRFRRSRRQFRFPFFRQESPSLFFLDIYKETQSKEIVTAHRAGFLK